MKFENYLTKLAPYAKAVTAFLSLLIPVIAALIQILIDATNGGDFSWGALGILAAALAALGAGTAGVYTVTNTKEG